jgi:hypothetical protein
MFREIFDNVDNYRQYFDELQEQFQRLIMALRRKFIG